MAVGRPAPALLRRARAVDVLQLLGGCFPSPGMTPERFWMAVAELPADAPEPAAQLEGDGSPMEEGARVEWVELDEAIASCVRGEIDDAKTELVLRRLRDLV